VLLDPLPRQAVWRHHTAREALEVVSSETTAEGITLRGVVTGVEDGVVYALAYEIEADADWRTRAAVVRSLMPGDDAEVVLMRAPDGRWSVDGGHRPELDGLDDVDLEASAMTNTLPAHRLPLAGSTPAPAAYVRLDLTVERLDQWYGPAQPLPEGGSRVGYLAPRFEADFDLTYDASGLVLDYPFLASRLV
jgi:hypothetical protein